MSTEEIKKLDDDDDDVLVTFKDLVNTLLRLYKTLIFVIKEVQNQYYKIKRLFFYCHYYRA